MSQISIHASQDSIAVVREFCLQATNDSGLSAEKVYAVLTAVEEAVWNIIEHSYAANSEGEIICQAESSPQGLTITLLDHGTPMPPDKIPNKEYLLNTKPGNLGGMGLFLMYHLMDSVEFDFSTPGVNKLTMTKMNS